MIFRLFLVVGMLLISSVANASVVSNSKTISVIVTSYSIKSKMSNGEKTHHRCVAISRDVVKDLRLRFGDEIKIGELGIFIYKDCMPVRWKRRIDIWLPSYQQSKNFGIKKLRISVVKRN